MTEEHARAYAAAAAAAVDVPLSANHLAGVVLQFQRIAALAALVTQFPLPETVEPAPQFRHDGRVPHVSE